MPLNKRHVLTVSLADSTEPPSEFRLFVAGINPTRKGDFLFDDVAAQSVMKDYTEHGVDLMMDLEHLSVAPLEITGDGRAFNSDAMAWFSLEVRNGELWAVNVQWTPEGADRVRNKKQRYISPAFDTDDEDRVVSIFNVALTSTPATDNTPALIAASKRLAMPAPEENKEGTKGKAASVREAIASAITALQDADKALGGGDIDEAMTAITSAQTAVDGYKKAAKELVPGLEDEGMSGAAPAAAPEGSDEDKAMRAMSAQLSAITGEASILECLAKVKTFKQSHVQLAAERAKLAAERAALESAERKDLVASMVKLGAEPPATAYADKEATKLAEPWASMPLVQLRERVKRLSGGKVQTGGPTAQKENVVITSSNGIEVSEFEMARLHIACDRYKTDFESAKQKYLGHRQQQLAGAEQSGTATRERLNILSSGVKIGQTFTDATGRHMLAQTPVLPIQEMGPSSQRALEEFRLEYNTSLAAMPVPWSETIGQTLNSSGLKETYPINFDAFRYVERTGQSKARSAGSKDVAVTKREFSDAHQVELKRLTRDFAYMLSWQLKAQRMAEARVFLRNELIVALLENGTTGYWGQTIDQATGIDGQPFFSASHKVHPLDPSIKFRNTLTTWGNLQASATPLNSSNLTTEKGAFYNVPGPNGKELGLECDTMLIPSVLKETANNLLRVQDLILAGKTSEGGVNNVFGQVKNPHYMSGLEYIRGPELAGTSVNADYYLISKLGISRGLIPWVLSEDPTEELRIWDESSDFYKDGGFIKIESIVMVGAALLYPHAIRLVKGA